jgi:DNA-binding NarL/FixJ family response regulator
MTLRVVLVDDHELMRDALRVRLSRSAAGLEVVGEACNAREALAEVGKTLPDLVVLDLNLPDQDGASLAAVIRSTWPKTSFARWNPP